MTLLRVAAVRVNVLICRTQESFAVVWTLLTDGVGDVSLCSARDAGLRHFSHKQLYADLLCDAACILPLSDARSQSVGLSP